MKTNKCKFLSLFLMLGSLLSTTSCDLGGELEGVEGTLKISIFEGGGGNTAFHKLAEAYKRFNPEANVVINYSPLVRDECQTAVDTNSSDTDIFFIDGCTVPRGVEVTHSIADISELFESKPISSTGEENILIKDKIQPEVLDLMKYQGDMEQYQGKYYTAPNLAGQCSVILNVDALNDVLGEGQWTEPKTSSEMFELCDRIVAADKKVKISGSNYRIYPFIYSSAVGYWRYMYYTWMAQYMGYNDYVETFLKYRINGEYNMEAFFTEGKTVAYKEIEKVLKRTNNYCDPNSLSNKFMASQKYFLQGRACMYVTGDWFEREMEGSSYNPKMKMIRIPMISSIHTPFEKKFSHALGDSAEAKETKLRAIINAVDNGEASFNGLSDAEFKYFQEIRGYTYSMAFGSYGIVPACSVNKDMALHFLRFFYSDEAIQIYLDDTKTLLPVVHPETYHITGETSDFRKSCNDIALSPLTRTFSGSYNDPIRYRAGLGDYVNNETPETAMGKKSGAMTAEQYLATERRLLEAKWDTIMSYVREIPTEA